MNKPWQIFSSVAVTLCFAAATAHADSITVDGKTYEDVLVYPSPTHYYVKLPAEGEVFSVAKTEVDQSSVVIVNDFSYRLRMRNYYDAVVNGDEEAQQRLIEQQQQRDTSNQQARLKELAAQARSAAGSAEGGGEISVTDEAPPGGGARSRGPGLGVTREQLVSTLEGLGFQITQEGEQGGNPVTVAESNITTIKMYGPDNGLTRIETTISGPMQAIFAEAQKMGQMNTTVSPQAAQVVNSQQAKLMTGQAIDETVNGVHVRVQANQQGENVTVNSLLEVAQ